MLSLTAKVATYDFYRALEKLTVNTGIDVPKSRYPALMRMNLQWRHLKGLKRGGRGHDPTGVTGTQDAKLAIRCPSCPLPGINLPRDWKTIALEQPFLYYARVTFNCNFRLKNQLISSYAVDPGLGTGMSYFGALPGYREFLLERINDKDISTCVGFNALAQANTKFSKGLRYTGVGACGCARSEMFMPNGVGNLQKGERYANVDYILASALRGVQLPAVVVSYDIACQYFINFFNRMTTWPDKLKLNEETAYSFHYVPGVGVTDGEAAERLWAPHNALGNSTKTQGPGSRHDVLDDHFGFWNWLKYIGMGSSLMQKYKAAVPERNRQVEAHNGFTASLPTHAVAEWTAMVTAWEQDSSHPKQAPSPYEVSGAALSEARVREDLAREEETRLINGGIALHEISPASFIATGLELEDIQRRLRADVKNSRAVTDIQKTRLTERRNALRTKIRNWERLQFIYMPGLIQLQDELARADTTPTSGPQSTHPENADICFPSTIPCDRQPTVCQSGLVEIEERLRTAQCHDSLDSMRDTLRLKTRMIAFKNQNHRGQQEGTRSRTLIDGVQQRVQLHADKYRHARARKLLLTGPGNWELVLRELLPSDARSYVDPEVLAKQNKRAVQRGAGGVDKCEIDHNTTLPNENDRQRATGETRRTLSWIWTTVPLVPTRGERKIDDSLRAEWPLQDINNFSGSDDEMDDKMDDDDGEMVDDEFDEDVVDEDVD
ncbi:hypothetical protein BJ138DRAFT_1118902 [Hygrophoropsis aurantiaca]|uniref:Uncharacterized protein n=1 Tax=Hygrophoropsis aurantiaca TaxID=72124 RepID=A0ACB7ZW72_9AGAM|nr:hypothetical protein BJ138DRAFT_1118902 [Hygrophoropsis aurantiaca]